MTASPYPVQVVVLSPGRFERVQLFLRLALGIAIGFVGVTLWWIFCALYLAFPVVAAISLSTRGPEHFNADVAPPLSRLVAWVSAFFAYMFFLIDRFPTGEESPDVRVTIALRGTPSASSALLRLITSLPSALVLSVLFCVSGLVCFVSALFILFTESEPRLLLRYQLGVIRWQTRLLGYHASLVDAYPPFSFDTDEESSHQYPVARAH